MRTTPTRARAEEEGKKHTCPHPLLKGAGAAAYRLAAPDRAGSGRCPTWGGEQGGLKAARLLLSLPGVCSAHPPPRPSGSGELLASLGSGASALSGVAFGAREQEIRPGQSHRRDACFTPLFCGVVAGLLALFQGSYHIPNPDLRAH